MTGPSAVSGGEVPLPRRPGALTTAPPVQEAADDDVVLVVGGSDGEDASSACESRCAVARLVLAGVAAQLEMPVAAVERLQTALDQLLRSQARDVPAMVELTRSHEALTVCVGPLVLRLPDRRRLEHVLEATTDDVVWGDDLRGAWVSARMSRRSSHQTTR